jgi:CubicO group peptidase (beta-lactamase class C family)
MNIRRLFAPLFFVSTAVALILRVFARRAPANPAAGNASCDAIDAYVERQMRHLNMPGVSLAIVEGDRVVHLRSFGRDRPGGGAPSPQTPFALGSTTKSFTGLAVMQLVEAGKIDLDAPVQRYLPWFRIADPRASALITVRHLLHQTSGLPTWVGEVPLADFDNNPDATERQARALSTLKLTRPVGSAFEYSNMNYNLLGPIIEAASGESYEEYVQKHIFTPLRMSHTYTSQAAARRDGLAVGHRYWFMVPVAAPNLPLPRGSLPGGLIISCAEDMARYLIALLNGGRYGDVQILSAAGIDELQRGVADFMVMGRSIAKYGMGWLVGKIGQTKLVSHGGTLPDFGSHLALLPEKKKGVVLLYNVNTHWMMPVLEEFGAGVEALLAGERPAPAPIPLTGMIPWALRAQLLVPVLQIVDIIATMRLLRRWRLDPVSRPSAGRGSGLYILLPLIPNLLVALALKPMLGRRRGYLMLYAPDYSWTALVCGSVATVWSFLRTLLVLRALRK